MGASGPHSRPRSSVVVTGSHRVVASVFRGFYRGTPVVFSSTKLIHEFGAHLIISSGRVPPLLVAVSDRGVLEDAGVWTYRPV